MADDIVLSGNQTSQEDHAVRMHVMPENIFEEDALFRKVNKIPAKERKVENLRQALPEPEPEIVEETEDDFEEVPVEEMGAIIPAALKRPSKKKSKMPLIIAAVVVALLVLGSAGAWYWFQGQEDDKTREVVDLIEDQNDLKDELAAEAEKQRLEEEARLAEEDKQKTIRDNQRLVDMNDWQEALNLYYQKYNNYPADFVEGEWADEDLVYLEEIPVDPINEEEIIYFYSRTGDSSYSLSFFLEIGINELGEGIHLLSEKSKISINGKITDIVVQEDTNLGPVVLTTTRDTDLDGVTDLEELLYGTDPQKFDSDDDSYTDHQELLNLYAPSGSESRTLLDVGLVQEYTSEMQNYKLYYPSTWKVQELDIDETEIMFVSDSTAEYIHLKMENNIGELALEQWVKLKMQETKVEYEANYYQEEFYTNKKELAGIWLPELFRIYFTDGQQIYSLSYDFDNLRQLAYQTTFEMMAKSFRLKGDPIVVIEEEAEVAGYEEENEEMIEEDSEGMLEDIELETEEIIEEETETTEGEEEFVDLLEEYFAEEPVEETVVEEELLEEEVVEGAIEEPEEEVVE